MDEKISSDETTEQKLAEMCDLCQKLEFLLKVTRNQGTEANNALWAIEEGKPPSDEPKTINNRFYRLSAEIIKLIYTAKEIMKKNGIDPITTVDGNSNSDIQWVVDHYNQLSKDNASYRKIG